MNSLYKKLPSIAVLTSTYARYDTDPQVPWMRETNIRLKDLGHQVEVIAPAFEGLESHSIDGIKVNRYRYLPKGSENLTHDSGAPNKINHPLTKLRAIPYLVAGFAYTTRYLIKNRPDIVKVHWPFPHGLMAWAGARIAGTKIVSVCHGAELCIVRNKPHLQRVLSWCLRHSDLVYCNSSHTEAQIRSLPKCEDLAIEIVTYGSTVQNQAKEVEAELTQSETKAPLLLSCGRVIERKGYPYLIQAMPQVLEVYPDAQLVITSDGDKRAECEEWIKKLKLEDSVTMTGYISNEELSDLYRNCTIYVHPSIIDSRGDTEGLGVVLVEALANKKPVVASAVGGIVDVIKEGVSGLLVDEKQPAQLADKITYLLANPDEAAALGQSGFEFGVKFFSWDNIILRLSDILDEVAAADEHPKMVSHSVQPATSKTLDYESAKETVHSH